MLKKKRCSCGWVQLRNEAESTSEGLYLLPPKNRTHKWNILGCHTRLPTSKYFLQASYCLKSITTIPQSFGALTSGFSTQGRVKLVVLPENLRCSQHVGLQRQRALGHKDGSHLPAKAAPVVPDVAKSPKLDKTKALVMFRGGNCHRMFYVLQNPHISSHW